jgi:hypothetical protein
LNRNRYALRAHVTFYHGLDVSDNKSTGNGTEKFKEALLYLSIMPAQLKAAVHFEAKANLNKKDLL